MLSKVTSHCPQGHELIKSADGSRTKKIKASEVLNVMTVGWCDVCIEPFAQDELRYSCASCMYDCCWKCHDDGREAYLVEMTFTSGPTQGETVWATMDVFKSKIEKNDLDGDGDDVVAFSGIKSFDCDFFDLTFGSDKAERRMIQQTSQVTFSKSTGGIKKFQFCYINEEVDKDYQTYGAAIEKVGVNDGFEKVPEDLLKGNWFGVDASTSDDQETKRGLGSLTFRRFGLIEVPGFGMPEAQNNKTVKLLREIAKDKRGIINPMRKVKSNSFTMASCMPSLFTSAGPVDADPSSITLPPTHVLQKANEDAKSAEIIGNLEKDQQAQTYQVVLQSGKVNHRDLIYASRLSLLAYLIEPLPFGDFFPASREKYLLSPVWMNFLEHIDENEGRELLRQWLGQNARKTKLIEDNAHEAFLAKFVSTYFQCEPTDPQFGYSFNLNAENGPLRALGLEYAKIHPERPGKEGVLTHRGTEAFVAVSQDIETLGGDICIVFQGTNDPRDLVVSFNGLTTPFEPLSDGSDAGYFACLQGRLILGSNKNDDKVMRVHLGFYNAFLSLRDEIDSYVRATLAKVPKDKNVRIVVTGHSLGGALASMCTAYFLQLFDGDLKGKASERYKIIDDEITGKASDRLRILCVTFGSPKVGTTTFVNWMDDHKFVKKMGEGETVRCKILRLIDVMDPIVTLPPSGGIFSYLHTARRGATVSKDGKMVFISREAADKYDDTARGLGVIVTKGQRAIQNHDLFLYLHKCLHFAWVLNDISDGDDWSEDPLTKAFGAPTYRYDKFVRSDDFRKGF